MINNSPGAIVRVIGVGNILLKDEGVGVRVAEELRKKRWPPSVEVIDGGVAGLGLLDFFQEATHIILIDAAEMNQPAGTVDRFGADEMRWEGGGPKFSMHDIALPEVLELARHLARPPQRVVIFGIQPKEISWGLGLSSEVEAAVPQVLEMVLGELAEAGFRPEDE